MSLSPQLIWNAVSIALGVIGGTLFLWAMFRGRPRGRLRCPKCWYDMKGVADASPEPPWTCPECGRVILAAKHLKRTRRRKRIATIAALIVCLSVYAPLARDRVIARGWIGAIPTTVLVMLDNEFDTWMFGLGLSNGTNALPTWRARLSAECSIRFEKEEMLRFQERLYGMRLWRHLEAESDVVTEQDRSARTRHRSSDPAWAESGHIAHARLRPAVGRMFRGASGWTSAEIDEELGRAVSLSIQAFSDLDDWAFGFPGGDMTHHTMFGGDAIILGQTDVVIQAELLAAGLHETRRTGRMIPSESVADLERLNAFESIGYEYTGQLPVRASDVAFDIQSFTGRAVFIPPLPHVRDQTVDDIVCASSVGDACDIAASRMHSPHGYDSIYWTLSHHGVEFGTTQQLSHLIEPRIYSLEPMFREHARHNHGVRLDWVAERQRVLDALISRSSDELWIGIGGNISPISPLFVVRSTPNGHARVARFLMDYRMSDHEPIPYASHKHRSSR